MYKITPQQRKIAKSLGVHIHPSHNDKYKIDVLDWKYNFILSCGASRYNDYFSYKEKDGDAYAEKRRELYKKRHHKDILKEGSRGYYAWKLLWNGD